MQMAIGFQLLRRLLLVVFLMPVLVLAVLAVALVMALVLAGQWIIDGEL